MVIDLLGVVEDGSPSDPSVPSNPRRAVSVVFGESVVIRLNVVTRSGQAYDLAGTTITLRIKRAPYHEPVIERGATVPGSDSHAEIVIAPSDYSQIRQAGERLIYDIFLVDGTDRFPILPLAHWTVEAATAAA